MGLLLLIVLIILLFGGIRTDGFGGGVNVNGLLGLILVVILILVLLDHIPVSRF